MIRAVQYLLLGGLLTLTACTPAGPATNSTVLADLPIVASHQAQGDRPIPLQSPADPAGPSAEKPFANDPVGSAQAQPTTSTQPRPGAAVQPQPTTETTRQPSYMVLPGGTIVSPERYYSRSLGQDTWYEIILPPGYHQSTKRYPVLYMLHGAMGGADEWIEIGIHSVADELWSAGSLDPFIVVLPEGGMLNYWLNHADGGPRYGDMVSFDIVREVDANYRTVPTPEFRAIGGLSMGGDAALRLALTHPDIFGIAGGHSPTTRLRYEDRPGPFYGDRRYWARNNSLWLLRNTDTAARLKIWIDVGDNDPWVFSGRELTRALRLDGVEHEYHEIEGNHEAEYWIANQPDYLRFYARAFAEAPAWAHEAAVAKVPD